jgi:DNA-binding response OmpR family regulator
MGEVKVDLVKRRVTKSDVEVHLTPIEFKLLTTLIKYEGRVITHRQLLKEVSRITRIVVRVMTSPAELELVREGTEGVVVAVCLTGRPAR